MSDVDVLDLDLIAFTIRYQDLLNELADIVGEQVYRQFLELGDKLRDDSIPVFAEQANPYIKAGQAEAIDLTTAWQREVGGAMPGGIIDLRDLPTPLWDDPFLRTWHQLKVGDPFNEARMSGAGQARALGYDSTKQAAVHRMGTSTKLKVVGYRRVPNATACEWCQVVSIQRYHSAQAASLAGGKGVHKSCQCAVVAIYGKNDPGQTLGRQRLKELKKSGAVGRASAARARGRAK